MRKNNLSNNSEGYKILVVDDEIAIVDSLSIFLRRSGYHFTGVTNPLEAIERVKNEHFDLMILDFIMTPIHGDEVVEQIRRFNPSIYILLLTGHKDLAPPLDTIKKLDIQGYCEKSDKFDHLLLLVESGIKSIEQMQTITEINNKLLETQKKIEKSYLDSIEILRKTVELRDAYTNGHSERVAEYSLLMADKLNLSDEDKETLKVGCLFHDIGKIGIPDSILLKPHRLTESEFSEIKKHPILGAKILANAELFEKVLPIVYYHHEHFDGHGYPKGLKGDKIPYLARIVTIADSFDAMTSKRAYRTDLEIDEVKDELAVCAGKQFDPTLTRVFLNILENDYKSIKNIQKKYNLI